ncbi:MAG: Rrf2 family transcriptional regulator [Clostridiales bacterium]|nr:Rrf2 family transcriptional regulator [Clostridiales bacterium]
MFVSREYDYAIRIVRALSEEGLTINQICEKENISYSNAIKIAQKLEEASLIKLYHGGGCELIKPPASITLLDIYTAIEEELVINECLIKDAVCPCPNNKSGKHCNVHTLLIGLQDHLANILQSANMQAVLNNEIKLP